jgi:uncharacterized protein (TIGR02217 family)
MAIPIDNVRLPEQIERGAVGGPRFNTALVTLDGGYEQSQQNWEVPRRAWQIGYGVQSKEDYAEVLAFFMARRGRARGFRFKDWSDYDIVNQQIGIGDATEDQFQIYKRYDDTALPFDRPITQIVAGSLTVTLNGTPTGSYALLSTGIIDFASPPGVGVVIRVSCEFDIPVRFDNDQMTVSLVWSEAGSIPSIGIIEVRV